jgi:hypothetical protein
MPDFTIHADSPHPTVLLLAPQNRRARDWCVEHLPGDAQMRAHSYAVEHRYIGPIAEGILDAQMTIQWRLA